MRNLNEREDLERATKALRIKLPKNLGDVIYSIRYRTDLPGRILMTQPKGKEWIIEGRGIRIALVTSGLYEKAYPEIVSAFRTLDLGDPAEFYDAIITAGFAMRCGQPGTLGELSPKPHPWLYAEAARIGLGITADRRSHVLGIEDSGAGICSIRLAGFAAIGVAGGNINQSGTRGLCDTFHPDLRSVLADIDDGTKVEG